MATHSSVLAWRNPGIESTSLHLLCWQVDSLPLRHLEIGSYCCCVASVVSNSVRPHRWQPTRLPRPWDSPGKNNGVGCHFLLQCMKVESESEVAQSCPTPSHPMDCGLPGSSVHGICQARVLEWVAIAFSILRCSHSNFLNKKGSQVLWGLNTIQKTSCLPLGRNSHFPQKIFQSFTTTPQAYFFYLSSR